MGWSPVRGFGTARDFGTGAPKPEPRFPYAVGQAAGAAACFLISWFLMAVALGAASKGAAAAALLVACAANVLIAPLLLRWALDAASLGVRIWAWRKLLGVGGMAMFTVLLAAYLVFS